MFYTSLPSLVSVVLVKQMSETFFFFLSLSLFEPVFGSGWCMSFMLCVFLNSFVSVFLFLPYCVTRAPLSFT